MFSNYLIAVVFTDDIGLSRRKRDDEIGHSLDGPRCTALHSYNDKTDDGIAWLFFARDVTPGVVAHEATHAVSRLLEYLGVTNYDQEIFAYLVEYIVEQVWKFKQEMEKEKCLLDLVEKSQPLNYRACS